MGNATTPGQTPSLRPSDMEDNIEAEDDDNDIEHGDELDFCSAFHYDLIFQLASKVTQRESKVSMYEDCFDELLRGLISVVYGTNSMTVGFSKFCDILSPKNLSNEELLEIFEKLDYEGRGAFHAVTVLNTIKKYIAIKRLKRISLGDDVCDVARRFDSCTWIPGFVDAYVDQKDDFKQHGMNILQFLHRNRLPSSDLQCDTTVAYMKMMKLREEIVSDFLERLTLSDDGISYTQETGSNEISSISGECPLLDGKDDSSSEMSICRVIALWSIRLLTVTARASLPLNPSLLDMALQYSRNSIRLLQPLSLCHDSLQRPSFLTTECFCEMASFIDQFPDRVEVLGLMLSFHLASGNLCEILQCLSQISASTKMVDCWQLQNKLSKVRQQLLRNGSRVIKLSLCGSDCEKNTKNDPDSIAELHWNQNAFSTKTGQTRATFVFESSEWVEFSKIKIKVANGNCGPKFGFVKVLSEWPAAGDRSRVAEELEKFSLYDKWTKSDYDGMASAASGQKTLVNIGPMAFFDTENHDEVDVEMKHSVFGKWLMVKFLNARDSEADHLEIVGVMCYGIKRTESHALLERQVIENIQNACAVQSNQLTVYSVLSFLLHVLANEKQTIAKYDYYFSRADQVYVDQRTGFVKSSGSSGWLVAKCPFTQEFSYFEIEIVESNEHGIIVGAVPVYHSPGLVDEGRKQIPFGYCTGYGRIYYYSEIISQVSPSGKGDKIGIGFRYKGHAAKSVYYTRNGKEIYMQNIPGTSDMYPAIDFERSGILVSLLDKRPWRNKDASVLEKEKRREVAGRSEFINPRYIDLSKVTVGGVWELVKIFPGQLDQSFILQLLNSMLPWSIPGVVQLKNSYEIFDCLCHFVDLENESGDQSLVLAARDLLMNGIGLFYPLKDDRLKMLYELINSPSTSASKSVIFQSLCRSFSRADMDDILSLPSSPLQELDSTGFLSTMEKLLSLSFQESSSLLKPAASNDTQPGKVSHYGEQILSGRKKSDHQLYLTQLLNRLQLQLFGWIRIHLRNPAEAEETEKHLLHYCSHLVVSKVEALLLKMTSLKDYDVEQILLELDTSALATTFPALALLLSQLSSDLSAKTKIKLLEVLKTSLTAVNRVLGKVPELTSVGACDEPKESETELKCWEVESLHDVQILEEIVKIFSFPGATIFEVEFDRKHASQHSDEYLEFNDSKGNTEVCFGRLSGYNYPPSLRFENSSYLRFIYHPILYESLVFGFKFKVRAKKAVVKRFHWLYDLYLGLCRLFGRLSGSLLDKSPVFHKSATAEDKIEAEMYRSELWTTIFRGGLVIKKFERSLSGNYETEDQSDVAELVYQLADLSTEKAKVFLERCEGNTLQSHDVGGEEIDQAVRSVFSALLWHTQSLRHDVSIYLRNELDGKISSGILEAYAAAEKLRLVLIAKRQSQREEEEEMSLKDDGDRKPVVDVVSLVEDKARFLLRFAGLSKVASKTEESKRRLESRISRHVSLSRCLNREPTVDLDIPVEMSKYPSFNLVFEFVQDAAWSCEKVEELLKRRCSQCEDLWKAYMLVCDCLRTVSDGHCKKLPCNIFLSELMSTQKKFGRHYADGLDGCGLALEANIRRSYYDLLRFMVSTLRKEEDKFKQGGYDIFARYTLHLLDISWQAFDFPFLVELRLPELYFSLASVFSSAVEQKPPLYGADETQEEYERNLALAAKASLDVSDFRTENSESEDTAQLMTNFVAKFRKSSFRCSGCPKYLPATYYRCLSCLDFAVCLECYENEETVATCKISDRFHSTEHELILLKYICIGCKGYITGARWHCKVCINFDLCNGCYKASNFPSQSSHTSDHGVISFPTPKVTQEYNKVVIKNPLEYYTYQHSWMLFVALSYDTLDFLSRRSSEQKADDSYLFAARQLLATTYNLALDYLISCLDSGDVVDSAIVDSSSTETETSKPEASTHNSNSQGNTRPLVTKTIGLITSLVSSRKEVQTMKDVTEVLTSEQFLFTLFDIARAEKVIDLRTRLMSLGLLGRLLQRMDISSQASESLQSEDSEMMIVDKKVLRMVHSLFDFGADCLEKRDLELAKAASEMLHTLQRNQNWTKLLSHRCSEIVSLLDKEPSLSSIFVLFAFTGFPKMLTVGTLVRISNTDGDTTHGVFLCSKKEDDKKSSVVELSSRQTIKVDEMALDIVTSDVLHLTDNQISLFFSFITNAIDQIKNGVEYSAKSMWILALAIKAALNSVNFSGCRTNGKFYGSSFLGCMNYLASLGTWLPKALLLQDLEILSLEVNQSPTELSSSNVEVDEGEKQGVSDQEDQSDSPVESLACEYQFTYYIQYQRLVPIRHIDEGTTQSSSAPEKKKTKEDPNANKNQEIDKGLATMLNLSDVLCAEVDVGDCVEESNLQKPELISSVDGEAIVTQKKTSKKLMKEQLKNVSDSGFPLKIVRALAIRYARHLLVAIISEWPEDGDQFAPQHIGCNNIADVFFIVVNLLGSSLEAETSLAKIVKRLINYCQPTDVDTIARASGFFVGASEGQTVSIIRQIPHPTGKVLGSGDGGDIVDGKTCFRDEVYIPGATSLNIRFEERFCAESDFELKFSSFPDLSENVQCFMNIPSDDWTDFNINVGGDRVYCVLAISEAKSSCFKIKVTGILSFPDCFNIGYMALDTILDKSEVVSFLPLKCLWRQLVSVANSSSKAQRLKVIRLLLRILSLQTKRSGCETLSVDLSYLRGLWKMYKKHTQDNETETIKPVLVLALTELFFIAEKVAQEWNIAENFSLSMEDDTQLNKQQ